MTWDSSSVHLALLDGVLKHLALPSMTSEVSKGPGSSGAPGGWGNQAADVGRARSLGTQPRGTTGRDPGWDGLVLWNLHLR